MDVQHDAQKQRFYLPLDPSGEAELTYQRLGQVIDLQHMYVPPSHRGRGIAGRVAKAAFEHARAEGLRVVPSCPFIALEFLPRSPEYQGLVNRPDEPGTPE